MQVNEYQKAAMATLNPALDKKDVLINSVMGLCGESGEAIDIVKKWLMQGHELDKEHLVRELGMWRGILPRLPRHWISRWKLFFRGIWTSCVSAFPTALTPELR